MEAKCNLVPWPYLSWGNASDDYWAISCLCWVSCEQTLIACLHDVGPILLAYMHACMMWPISFAYPKSWLLTKHNQESHHTLFLVSSGVWTRYYAKYRSEAVTSLLSLQKLDHPPHLPRLHVPQIEFKEHQHWKVFHLICQWTCDGGQHFHSLFALLAEVSEQGPTARETCMLGLVGRLPWVGGRFLPPLLRQTQVRACDLTKCECRREDVTCMFSVQKLDHPPHLPR